jgi:hypothetical protein
LQPVENLLDRDPGVGLNLPEDALVGVPGAIRVFGGVFTSFDVLTL